MLAVALLAHEAGGTVALAQEWFLDLPGSVARDVSKDNLARTLVTRKLAAVVHDVGLGRPTTWLELNDGCRDLSQTLIGKTDNCDILNCEVSLQEVLNLNRIEVLASCDDDVLLAVDEPIEAFVILLRHVTRVEPAVDERLGRRLRVVVVASHEARTLDAQLADFTLTHLMAVFTHNLALPAVSRYANGTHVIDVLDTQVHTPKDHSSCRSRDAERLPSSAG